MARKLSLFAFFILLSGASFAAILPTGFTERLIAEGLDPTDLALLPDGRILIAIKSGKVLIVEDGVLRASPLLSIEDKVDNYNERGLGHILLDPDFSANGFYYLFYTVEGQFHNRVSRFTAYGNYSDPASEQVIIDLDPMTGSIHNGGDMAFGADGKLYVGSGDGADFTTAQSFSSLLGKVLRINRDGTIPDDNPFDAVTTGKYKAIYAIGLRNAFSIDIDPVSGRLFAGDVGGADFEEVNEILPGGNYGWPSVEGMHTTETLPPDGTYHDPLYAYPHGDGNDAGCAVVGAAFYQPHMSQFPEGYVGKFFFADYCNGYIKYMDPANPAMIEVFAENVDRPVSIVIAHDGTMYYLARGGLGGGTEGDNTASNSGTLWQINYTGSGAPTVAVPPRNALASVGETAIFSVTMNGTQPMVYQWKLNGVDIPGADSSVYMMPSVQLPDDGAQLSVVATNDLGTVTSDMAILTVTINARPEPAITWSLPGDATLYRGNDLLSFSGTAMDNEEGELPVENLTWKIDFYHDQHFHPAMAATQGIGAMVFQIPKVGETSPNVWYRIQLTATDNGDPALSKTVYADIFPAKSDLTVQTEPDGLTILLDGHLVTSPHVFTSVVNTSRTFEGPVAQLKGDSVYLFSSWLDNSQRMFVTDTPEESKIFVARFDLVPKADGTGLAGSYYNLDKSFEGTPVLTRVDPEVNFDWEQLSPDPLVNVDNFSVRWEGEVMPQFSDTYFFHLTGDDGIRLWVDSVLLIDEWLDQGGNEYTVPIQLEANKKYPIRIEYYENMGEAIVSLAWSSSLVPKQVVPRSQLFPPQVTTGLSSDMSAGLILYPNAVKNELNIRAKGWDTGSWYITDMLGRTMMSGTMSEQFAIDTSSLREGLYVFRAGDQAVRLLKR